MSVTPTSGVDVTSPSTATIIDPVTGTLFSIGANGADTVTQVDELTGQTTSTVEMPDGTTQTTSTTGWGAISDPNPGDNSTTDGGLPSFLVPTVDASGHLAGYTLETAVSVGTWANGPQYTFPDGTVMRQNTNTGDSVFTIPLPNGQSAILENYSSDGTTDFYSTDQNLGQAFQEETTTTQPDNGPVTAVFTYTDPDTGKVYSSGTSTTPIGGQATTSFTGAGIYDPESDANITLAPGSTGVLSGADNTVAVGNGGAATLTNDGDTVVGGQNTTVNASGNAENITVGVGSSVAADGGANIVNAVSGDQVTLSGTSANADTLNANSASVTLGNATSATVNGSTDTLTAGNDVFLDLNGSGDVATLGTGTSIDAVGGGNDITAVSADSITIAGTGTNADIIDASGEQIGGNAVGPEPTGIYLANGATATVNGNTDGLSVGNDVFLDLNGSGDVATLGTGTSIDAIGGGNDINAVAADSITIGSTGVNADIIDASGELAGGNAVGPEPTGIDVLSGATATINGNTDSLVAGNDVFLDLNGSGDVATLGTGTSIDAIGGGNDINAVGADSITIGSTGVNADIIDASGEQAGGNAVGPEPTGIDVLSGATATINGNTDSLVAGNDVFLDLNGSGDVATLGTGTSIDAVGGGNDINAVNSDSLTISGTNGNTDIINASGEETGNNVVGTTPAGIYLANYATATINGSTDDVTAANDALVTLNGSGDVATLGTGTSIDATGGGNDITAVSSDSITIGGTNGTADIIDASGEETGGPVVGTVATGIFLANGASATVNGSNDSVSLTASDTITLTGAGDAVSAGSSSDVIYLDSSGDVVDLSNATIVLEAGVSATIDGNEDNVIGGTNDDVSFLGTGDVATLSDGTVNLESSSTSVTIIGAKDTADSSVGGVIGFAGNNDVANISGGTVNIDDKGATDGVEGSHDNIYEVNSDHINIDGTYDEADANSTDTTDYVGGNYVGDDATGGGTVEDGGNTEDSSSSFFDPLVLNFNRKAVTTVLASQSNVVFDMLADGIQEQTGWIADGEGFLLVDADASSPVTDSSKMVKSLADLEALDSNGDGKLTAADAGFDRISVWVPGANGIGGTVETLAQLGIVEIDLTSTADGAIDHGNTIGSTFRIVFDDGSSGQGAAVDFAQGAEVSGTTQTISYNAGQGTLVVTAAALGTSLNDTLAFGTGTAASDATVTGNALGDLVISLGLGDSVTLQGALLQGSGYPVKTVSFGDGTAWSYQQLLDLADTGTAANTALYGDAGANVLDSKGEATYEQGNGGNDTYIFNAGYGDVTINNEIGNGTVPSGQIELGGGISADQLWFERAGNDLDIDVLGTKDQLTVQDWFGSNAGAQLSTFETGSGLILDGSGVNQLVAAMSAFTGNEAGSGPPTAMPQDVGVQTALAAAWHH